MSARSLGWRWVRYCFCIHWVRVLKRELVRKRDWGRDCSWWSVTTTLRRRQAGPPPFCMLWWTLMGWNSLISGWRVGRVLRNFWVEGVVRHSDGVRRMVLFWGVVINWLLKR